MNLKNTHNCRHVDKGNRIGQFINSTVLLTLLNIATRNHINMNKIPRVPWTVLGPRSFGDGCGKENHRQTVLIIILP